MRHIITTFLFLLLTALPVFAQDPVQVDPRHFKIEYEDDKVRVIRFILPPGEKSPMHSLADRIQVSLTSAHLRLFIDSVRLARGTQVSEFPSTAGSVQRLPAINCEAQNDGSTTWEAILTEFKPLVYVGNASESTAQIPVAIAQSPAPVAPPAPRPAQLPPPARQEETTSRLQVATPEPIPANPAGTKSLFVNGTDLAYVDRGQGSPIVFVHDSLGDYRSWQPQFAALSRNHHVIAYSRRYHFPTHSTGKEGDYSYEQHSKDLGDFIRALNLGPVALVGHGYGAAIAAIVAAEHPELVKTLTISEPGFEAVLDSSRAYRSRYAREEIYNIIRKPLSKGDVEKPVQIYLDWLGAEKWSNLGAEDQYRRKQNSNALRAQTAFPLAPAFACADAKKISAPTLLISGEKRSPNSAEITGILSACIPNAERVTVPNSGPAPYLDNSEGYSRVLNDFLGKH